MDGHLSIDRRLGLALADLDSWSNQDDGVFYHKPKTELARPYLRDEYLVNMSRNKKVLHFGFADSPFTKERYGNGQLLHSRIRAVAKDSWGADIDKSACDIYEKLSTDKQYFVMDVCDPNLSIEEYRKDFDIIVFGEILEHLLNPGLALQNLRKIAEINNAKLIVTTPNALNAAGFVAAVKGIEIVHPEHYYYYSPITLTRLLRDCGFNSVLVKFYSGSNTLNLPGLTYPGLIAEARIRK